MTAFVIHNMAPIMFAALVALLLLGYPVAFALAFNGLAFGLLGIELGLFPTNLFQALPDRLLGIMSNETLLAIPFFTFMGLVLERSGMAEDLLDTIGQLFGPIRGGLAYAVVLVGALLAATTGVVAASVIAMGLISLPIMLRYGYDRRLATGVIAASGTLAQIIPPSLVLIVMADQLRVSVGDMYKGALIPGLVLTGLYLGYVFLLTVVYPAAAPALPRAARNLGSGIVSLAVMAGLAGVFGAAAFRVFSDAGFADPGIWAAVAAVLGAYLVAGASRRMRLNLLSRLAEQVIIVLIPPLALVFLVLGTIFLGIATPTEGGAMGAVGAMALAAAKGRLRLPMMRQALEATAKLSAFVIFILIGARVFSLTFYGVNGHVWVEELLTGLPGGEIGFLIVVNAIVFVLAFFLDFFELAFIIIPLLGPVAAAMGIDLVWFGVMLGINMQTSFMHPPFGFSLFYLRSVAPRETYVDKVTGEPVAGVSTWQIYWGAVPFVVIQVVMLGLTIAFPQMVLHGRGGPAVNAEDVQIRLPGFGALPPAPGAAPGLGLGTPPSFGPPSLAPPSLAPPSLAPPSLAPSGSAPSAPPPAAAPTGLSGPPSFAPPAEAPDLSQPPSFN